MANDSAGKVGLERPFISDDAEQFYLSHPDHHVRAENVARRLAPPGTDRQAFKAFVDRVEAGIDHEDA